MSSRMFASRSESEASVIRSAQRTSVQLRAPSENARTRAAASDRREPGEAGAAGSCAAATTSRSSRAATVSCNALLGGPRAPVPLQDLGTTSTTRAPETKNEYRLPVDCVVQVHLRVWEQQPTYRSARRRATVHRADGRRRLQHRDRLTELLGKPVRHRGPVLPPPRVYPIDLEKRPPAEPNRRHDAARRVRR